LRHIADHAWVVCVLFSVGIANPFDFTSAGTSTCVGFRWENRRIQGVGAIFNFADVQISVVVVVRIAAIVEKVEVWVFFHQQALDGQVASEEIKNEKHISLYVGDVDQAVTLQVGLRISKRLTIRRRGILCLQECAIGEAVHITDIPFSVPVDIPSVVGESRGRLSGSGANEKYKQERASNGSQGLCLV